jgi:5-methylthioadenosine/S-adenosylhomocysteine deaminase
VVSTAPDLFGSAYAAGVTEALGPPPGEAARAERPQAAAPPGAFALHGAVITPMAALRRGYVVVDGGLIADVATRRPQGVPVLETDGVILPGLIDLHGHPEFNVFAAWEPPTQFANRYRWRDSEVYQRLVREPQNILLAALPPRTQLRYAEARALVSGVTAIQGASGRTARAADTEPLVRNIDLWIFGQHRARSMIDLPSSRSGRSWTQLQSVLAAIEAGDVDTFYLHLCEGRRDDPRSQTEFARFVEFNAATPATVVIHASALSRDQLGELADAGCKLVWSPQSNLRLYGETTLAAEAIRRGMPVALGADWLPSGSTSLLAEMRVARRVLADQGMPIPAADLVGMVTAAAAHIAGLGDHLGALTPGRPADIVVFERHHADPYENVCQAGPSEVELVLIGGDITYGRDDWFTRLASVTTGTTIEALTAWGKRMRLDTGFQVHAGPPPPSLSALRADLITHYPAVGPIFA